MITVKITAPVFRRISYSSQTNPGRSSEVPETREFLLFHGVALEPRDLFWIDHLAPRSASKFDAFVPDSLVEIPGTVAKVRPCGDFAPLISSLNIHEKRKDEESETSETLSMHTEDLDPASFSLG